MFGPHFLPVFTAFLSAGMTLGLLGSTATIWAALGLASVLGLLFCLRRALGVASLFAGAALGIFLAQRAVLPPAPESALGQALASGKLVHLSARILTGPHESDSGGARMRVRLSSLTIDGEGHHAKGVDAGAELFVGRGLPELLPGDQIAFSSVLSLPRGFANPGAADARLASLAHGVVARAHVARAREIRLLAAGWPWSPRRLAHRAHLTMRRHIAASMDERAATFLRTAVLGERAAAGEAVELGFKAAGATHALSVSGLHLAAVAALFFVLVRALGGCSPWLALRVPPKVLAAALSIPAVLFYTLLAGEAVATWRSALMASVLFGALICNRPLSFAHAVAGAALVLLADSPLWLLDVSFQLSFVSVLALGAFAGALAPKSTSTCAAPMENRERLVVLRAWRWVRKGVAATLAAGLLTTPLVAFHFGELTPAAPLGNLLLTPQVELLVVPLGLGGATLAMVAPWLGWLPLKLSALCADLCLWTAESFARLAPIWSCRHPNALETLLLTVGLAAWLARLRARALSNSPVAMRRYAVAAIVLLAAALVSLGAREVARRTDSGLRITFVDVGQGDAALVEGPRGFVALIDGGGLPNTRIDVGARVLEPLLRRKGIAHIDLVVVSHPHPDHVQGLLRVLSRFSVERLWALAPPVDNGRKHAGDHEHFGRLLALAREHGARWEVPARLAHAGLVIEPLGPWVTEPDAVGLQPRLHDRIAWPEGLHANDASLTVRLHFAGRQVLFPGDAEARGELELCGRARSGALGPGGLSAEFLKVGHHGSRTSSSEEFLRMVKPRLAIISDGVQNRFGFPHPEVLARYRALGIPVLRTDLSGAITLRMSSDGKWEATCVLGCR